MKMWILNILAVGACGCTIFDTDNRDQETFREVDWKTDVVPYYPDTVNYLENAEFIGTPEVIQDFYVGRRLGITFRNNTGEHAVQVRVPWRTNWEIVDECGSIYLDKDNRNYRS